MPDAKANWQWVEWAECSLIIGTGCRVQVFSMILDSSVGLSADIQSAGDLVSETLGWNPAFSRKITPFDSNTACLCQRIEINNNKHMYIVPSMSLIVYNTYLRVKTYITCAQYDSLPYSQYGASKMYTFSHHCGSVTTNRLWLQRS